jgi:hypothetical protein
MTMKHPQIFRISGQTLTAALSLGAATTAFALSSCINDPVRSAAIAALGDETPGYPANTQYHRPGQPCGTCHESRGPGSPKFVLAGTVFWGRCNLTQQEFAANPKAAAEKCDRQPVDRAEIRVREASGTVVCFNTNCAGNFYVTEPEGKGLTFPLQVSVTKRLKDGSLRTASMGSHIGRDVSCSNCHDNPARPESPGQVYLYDYDDQGKNKLPAEAKALKCPPAPPDVDPPKECVP